jgi:large subunit ribosomal protein L17
MRHLKSGRKLSRNTSHREALMRNMVTSLLKFERIQTTLPKAKELRKVADQVITLVKRGDLHAQRQVRRIVREKSVFQKLFKEHRDKVMDRMGGYTRIYRLKNRIGDGAQLSIIEMVYAPERQASTKKKKKKEKEAKEAAKA